MSFSPDERKAFFAQTTLSVDDLKTNLDNHLKMFQLPEQYDFTTFRMYPMIYTRDQEDIATCIDTSFLAEKVSNGIYFTIHNALKDRSDLSEEDGKDHKMFMSYWGDIFESYVNDRLKDIQFGAEVRELYTSPYLDEPPSGKEYQAFDAAIDYKADLVVMEHKGKFAPLTVRYSGARDVLIDEFTSGRGIGKAIKQLAERLEKVFDSSPNGKRHTFSTRPENERVAITFGLREINRVRRVYPVIVHQDFYLRPNGVNKIARKIFNEELSKRRVDTRLIKSLTLLTVEDIEVLVPYLKEIKLPLILQKYSQIEDPFETFQNFLKGFVRKWEREKQRKIRNHNNEWISLKAESLLEEIKDVFIDLSD